MTVFALIHGGGGSPWDWHLLEGELRDRGHDTVAVQLPMSDPQAGLWDYAYAVVRATDGLRPLVLVAHSWGGFIGPLAGVLTGADALVLVSAMIPSPGETPDDWWQRSGRPSSGITDQYELYYHDVPRELAQRVSAHDSALAAEMSMDRVGREPWPLAGWPEIPTRYVLCRDDRLFTAEFVRRHVAERLGITPDEMSVGHMVMLSWPGELADYLVRVFPAAP